MIRFGVIGYGYWGPNIARNLGSINGAQVVAICDRQEERLSRAKQANPYARLTRDSSEVLRASDIDAVALITPVQTHFKLAEEALHNGKHVFVEKPFTATARQAEQLIELAEKWGLTIMVDHTFLFTGAVRKIRELIERDELGKLYYYDSTRVNLGLFQHDVNVIWDLAPHDLSIVDYLIGGKVEAVVATGASHVNGHADVAYLTIYLPNKVIAHLNVNWISPVKVRTTLIAGEKKMLVWNDLEADEKVKVYDRGVKISSHEGVYAALVSYRSGDMWSPRLESTEALKTELSYFVECVESQQRPINDGIAGLRVVRMLEAAEASLQRQGEVVCA